MSDAIVTRITRTLSAPSGLIGPGVALLPRLAVLAVTLASPAAADTFVLVHGAFVGSWAWADVTNDLTADGHSVIAPEMTGLGSRAAELSPTITLGDHIADVTAAIDSASGPVILVAHSWGTRPAVGAWDLRRDAVAHIVLIEGLGPLTDDGPGVIADSATLRQVMTLFPDIIDTGLIPAPPDLPATADRPTGPMPIGVLYAEVPLTNGPLPATPGTYIAGEGSFLPVLADVGRHLQAWRGWDFHLIDGGHDLPLTNPEDLSAILRQIAGD